MSIQYIWYNDMSFLWWLLLCLISYNHITVTYNHWDMDGFLNISDNVFIGIRDEDDDDDNDYYHAWYICIWCHPPTTNLFLRQGVDNLLTAQSWLFFYGCSLLCVMSTFSIYPGLHHFLFAYVLLSPFPFPKCTSPSRTSLPACVWLPAADGIRSV